MPVAIHQAIFSAPNITYGRQILTGKSCMPSGSHLSICMVFQRIKEARDNALITTTSTVSRKPQIKTKCRKPGVLISRCCQCSFYAISVSRIVCIFRIHNFSLSIIYICIPNKLETNIIHFIITTPNGIQYIFCITHSPSFYLIIPIRSELSPNTATGGNRSKQNHRRTHHFIFWSYFLNKINHKRKLTIYS